MKYAIRILICVAALSLAPASWGDTLYNVTGSFSLLGQDVCGGQCVETVNFSLTLDEAVNPHDGEYFLTVLNPTANSSGPLAPVDKIVLGADSLSFLGFFFGPDNVEVDTDLNSTFEEPAPFTPAFFDGGFDDAVLFSCRGNAVCEQDFCPPSMFGCEEPFPGAFGSVQATVTSTPEPSALLMLAFTLPLLILRRDMCARIFGRAY